MPFLFSSESVCSGHPDKICDQISDAILDALLAKDPNARVAIEVAVKESVFIIGEVSSDADIQYEPIARQVIEDLGYIYPEWGFSYKSPIHVQLHQQSSDISCGVDNGGAGDQGLMFGYACKQTPELMPLPIMLAHSLARGLDDLMNDYDWLRPDGKTQVTVSYSGRKPSHVPTIVLAKPIDPNIPESYMRKIMMSKLVIPLLSAHSLDADLTQVIINGTGKWEVGGPASDSGLTGRKIIVDTYGGWARHGGGCFSGKDATKVDRSGAYIARYAAKQVVAAGLADECELQLAYTIGGRKPVSVMIETFGSHKTSRAVIRDFVSSLTDFSPEHIVELLQLRKPQFGPTARYGHFGHPEYSWEKMT